MSDSAAKYIGSGVAWLGFWVMLGLIHFGDNTVIDVLHSIVSF